jgi:PAS domain-containing protein
VGRGRQFEESHVQKTVTDLQNACAFAEAIVNTVREPLVVLDQDLRVVAASRSFYRTFKVSPKDTEGKLLYELSDGVWDIAKLRVLLEKILPANGAIEAGAIKAIKHAFNGTTKDGQITVAFDVSETDWKLSVTDNGIGNPAVVFAQPKTGLGTGIVNALAKQLDAKTCLEMAKQAKELPEDSKMGNPIGRR